MPITTYFQIDIKDNQNREISNAQASKLYDILSDCSDLPTKAVLIKKKQFVCFPKIYDCMINPKFYQLRDEITLLESLCDYNIKLTILKQDFQ